MFQQLHFWIHNHLETEDMSIYYIYLYWLLYYIYLYWLLISYGNWSLLIFKKLFKPKGVLATHLHTFYRVVRPPKRGYFLQTYGKEKCFIELASEGEFPCRDNKVKHTSFVTDYIKTFGIDDYDTNNLKWPPPPFWPN